jgi:hypothetical protein
LIYLSLFPLSLSELFPLPKAFEEQEESLWQVLPVTSDVLIFAIDVPINAKELY